MIQIYFHNLNNKLDTDYDWIEGAIKRMVIIDSNCKYRITPGHNIRGHSTQSMLSNGYFPLLA